MLNITPIIEALVALLAVIITAFVIPYIKARTTEQQQKQIEAWVKIAVTAAEQMFTGSGRGGDKLKYVLNWFSARGIAVDTDKLHVMIESAVYELTSTEQPYTVTDAIGFQVEHVETD